MTRIFGSPVAGAGTLCALLAAIAAPTSAVAQHGHPAPAGHSGGFGGGQAHPGGFQHAQPAQAARGGLGSGMHPQAQRSPLFGPAPMGNQRGQHGGTAPMQVHPAQASPGGAILSGGRPQRQNGFVTPGVQPFAATAPIWNQPPGSHNVFKPTPGMIAGNGLGPKGILTTNRVIGANPGNFVHPGAGSPLPKLGRNAALLAQNSGRHAPGQPALNRNPGTLKTGPAQHPIRSNSGLARNEVAGRSGLGKPDQASPNHPNIPARGLQATAQSRGIGNNAIPRPIGVGAGKNLAVLGVVGGQKPPLMGISGPINASGLGLTDPLADYIVGAEVLGGGDPLADIIVGDALLSGTATPDDLLAIDLLLGSLGSLASADWGPSYTGDGSGDWGGPGPAFDPGFAPASDTAMIDPASASATFLPSYDPSAAIGTTLVSAYGPATIPTYDPSMAPAPVEVAAVPAASDPAVQAAPTPGSTGPRVLILNPKDSGGSVHYTLDSYPFTIDPDSSQDLGGRDSWVIEFDRGDGGEPARYTLSEGTYRFLITPKGWELKTTTYNVTLDNSGSDGEFFFQRDGVEESIPPRGSKAIPSKFPIVVRFDRGDGGQPAERTLENGRYRVGLAEDARALDLFLADPGVLAADRPSNGG